MVKPLVDRLLATNHPSPQGAHTRLRSPAERVIAQSRSRRILHRFVAAHTGPGTSPRPSSCRRPARPASTEKDSMQGTTMWWFLSRVITISAQALAEDEGLGAVK